MNPKVNVLLVSVVGLALSACSAPLHQSSTTLPIEKQLVGSGFARYTEESQATKRWLQTQQQAKLDAYRDLAEQVYRVVLKDGRTVGHQVVADERYRQYVDIYLRQAKASEYRNARDVLKAQMTLTLTPRFFQCLQGDVSEVSLCLLEQNKSIVTRIGQRTATSGSINLACAQADCSDRLAVGGFDGKRNPVDAALLEAGLYDSEWFVNTGGDVMGRYFLLQGILNGL